MKKELQEYEIMTKYKNNEWEYCDTAKGKKDLNYLLEEYKLAYGSDFKFKYKKVN